MKLRRPTESEKRRLNECIAILDFPEHRTRLAFPKDKFLELGRLMENFVKENKDLFICTACNGSGKYDDGSGRSCGCCNGSGVDLEP